MRRNVPRAVSLWNSFWSNIWCRPRTRPKTVLMLDPPAEFLNLALPSRLSLGSAAPLETVKIWYESRVIWKPAKEVFLEEFTETILRPLGRPGGAGWKTSTSRCRWNSVHPGTVFTSVHYELRGDGCAGNNNGAVWTKDWDKHCDLPARPTKSSVLWAIRNVVPKLRQYNQTELWWPKDCKL